MKKARTIEEIEEQLDAREERVNKSINLNKAQTRRIEKAWFAKLAEEDEMIKEKEVNESFGIN